MCSSDLVLVVIAIAYIYPFLIQVATSFKTDAEAQQNALSLLPRTWTTAAYQKLFGNSDFPLWFRNSLVVTVCVTVGRVFVDSLAGYALSRLRFFGRSVAFAALVALFQPYRRLTEIERSRIESEQRFRRALDASTESNGIVGPDGRYRYANQASIDLLGYGAEEVLGHHYEEFLVPDDSPEIGRAHV